VYRVNNREESKIITRSLRIDFDIVISRSYLIRILAFRPNPSPEVNLFIVNHDKKTVYLKDSFSKEDLQVVSPPEVTVVDYKASAYLIRKFPLLKKVEGRDLIFYLVCKCRYNICTIDNARDCTRDG